MALGVSVLFAINARAFQPGIAVVPLLKCLPHAQAIAGSDRESNAKNANGCKICSIFPSTTSLLYANWERIIPCQNDRVMLKERQGRKSTNASSSGELAEGVPFRSFFRGDLASRWVSGVWRKGIYVLWLFLQSVATNVKEVTWSGQVFHSNSCPNTLFPKFFHNSSWFEQEPMLLVWDIIGPGRCIENKGGTGQIRVFVEMNAFYTWPGAWFAVLLLLSTSVACGAEAGVKDSFLAFSWRVRADMECETPPCPPHPALHPPVRQSTPATRTSR